MSTNQNQAEHTARSWQAEQYSALATIALEAAQAPDFDPIGQRSRLSEMLENHEKRMSESIELHGPEAIRGQMLRTFNQLRHALGFLHSAIEADVTTCAAKESVVSALESHLKQRAFNAWEDNVCGRNQLDDVLGYDTYLLVATGVVPGPTNFDNVVQAFGAEAVIATLSLG